jgi:hypothetical protein
VNTGTQKVVVLVETKERKCENLTRKKSARVKKKKKRKTISEKHTILQRFGEEM